jgi:hypothetical protein
MNPGFRRFAAVTAGLALGLVSTAGAADLKVKQDARLKEKGTYTAAKSANGMVSVIVKWDAEPLAKYRGGIAGLAATSPEALGSAQLDVRSDASKAYARYLAGKENTFEAALQRVAPQGRIVHRYRSIIGGVSVVVPRSRVAELRQLPGVKAVYQDALRMLETDRSPEYIGAPVLWNQVGGQANAGHGIVVGIVDSGIWPEHPSLEDTGFPAPPATWHGTDCEFDTGANPGDPFSCNNKLIGASRHMATFDALGGGAGTPLAGEFTSARDNNGHGSHTATTAAGNMDVLATTGTHVSGIAPAAHVAIYKVCFTIPDGRGSCYNSDSAAAIEQAIADGVNVLNFSVGGGDDPYSDAASLAFLDAYAAGVFVACSAGNDGPDADTVGHKEPWVTTVAATTTDKGFVGSVSISDATYTGISATTGYGPGQMVLAADYEDGVDGGGPTCPAVAEGESDALCCNPFPADTFPAGSIVVCKRGTNARVAKSGNVQAGGAAGMVLYNPTANNLVADLHAIPSVHIDNVQGAALLALLGSNPGISGTITGGGLDLSGEGDLVADFSSRGGVGQTLGVSKPDIGAPGVDILAANTPAPASANAVGGLFQIISGTSMASPHIAGAGAVMKQLHPTWTPGQIKSALMMTANFADPLREEDHGEAGPFEIGSGRVDLTRSGSPGFVIADTAENFWNLQDNLTLANYPSLYWPNAAGRANIPRSLAFTDGAKNWNITVVSPPDLKIKTESSVKLKGNKPSSLLFEVDASLVPVGEVRHAQAIFVNKDKVRNFPITVVRRDLSTTVTHICEDDFLSVGEEAGCEITVSNFALQPAEVDLNLKAPGQITLKNITGATKSSSTKIQWKGTLAAALPRTVSVDVTPGSTPAGGYLPLSLFGIGPIGGVGDETITNFNVPSFTFGGNTYSALGMVSNGYIVLGGGDGDDVFFEAQSIPNTARPNAYLAPFWTDLNPAAGGAMRIGTLTDGVSSWIVCEWTAVRNFSDTNTNTFQVWIGYNGVEDVTWTYGTGSSSDPFANVGIGAENAEGTSGDSFLFAFGAQAAPPANTEFKVTTAPGAPGGTQVIDFTMKGKKKGVFNSCAEAQVPGLFGTVNGCFPGEVGVVK